eukprot:s2715_g3.t1
MSQLNLEHLRTGWCWNPFCFCLVFVIVASSSFLFAADAFCPTEEQGLWGDGARRIGRAIELEEPQVLVAFSWGAALAMRLLAVTLEGRERRAASMDGPATGEVVASFASVHSRNQSMGGTSICTAEVWDDVELDLPMESPQLAAATAISCASTLVQRRISRSSLGGDSFSDSRRRP